MAVFASVTWERALTLALLVAIALGGSLILRFVMFRILHAWARRTATRLDDAIVQILRWPSLVWCLALAVYVGLQMSALPAKALRFGDKVLGALIVLSLTLVAIHVADRVLLYYAERSGVVGPASGIGRTLARITVGAVGFVMVLHTLGVSIAPLVTALGVGGLAVGLALQPSLANLFAGMHIVLEQPVHVGDYVKLASGEEGYVTDIGWRTTRLRALANNIIIVPNTTVVQSTITNYHLPEPRMSLLIRIGVSYDADPWHVEEVLVDETLRAADEVPGLLKEPAPVVRFLPGFEESAVTCTLICQVREFVDQYLVQHELRKRIVRRFRQERIEIPFPIRTLRWAPGHQPTA